jgi:uncharacterized protein involved in exopolysaccharide biosynthesis
VCSDAGASAESRSAMRAITSLNDRLEAERRQYRLQTAQREQQLALLGPQDSAARAAIQEAQVCVDRITFFFIFFFFFFLLLLFFFFFFFF